MLLGTMGNIIYTNVYNKKTNKKAKRKIKKIKKISKKGLTNGRCCNIISLALLRDAVVKNHKNSAEMCKGP